MKNKKVLKLIAVFIMICITVNAFAISCFAESESRNITVYIANNGAPVVYNKPLTVTDADGDGDITINDALIITHELYYADGINGYETANTEWGLSVTKLWGNTNNGSFGYYLNKKLASGLNEKIYNAYTLYAFCYQDAAGWSDKFAFFDISAITGVVPGEEIYLTLSMVYFDPNNNWEPTEAPVEGAVITIDGIDTEYVTGSNGRVAIVLNDKNSHIISARMTDGSIITPAVTSVIGETDSIFATFNGNTYYYTDNFAQTGFKTIDDAKYYFNKDGSMVKSKLMTIDGKKYYFGKDGAVYTKRLISVNGKKYYMGADGAAYTKRLISVNGKKYYMGADGVAYTKRLISVNGKKYYMGKDGVAYTKRLISVNGKKYYMGSDGVAYTKRLISVDGKKYYMGADGVAYTKRLISVNGKKYYMGADGVAYKSRLISVNGKKYYIGKDCVAYKNKWASLNGKKYYFGSDCVMVTGWKTIKNSSGKNVKYYFDTDGVYIPEKKLNAYSQSYKKLVQLAKLGHYNSGSKTYIYAFDTITDKSGQRICCLEYNTEDNKLYVSYITNSSTLQTHDAVLIEKTMTNNMSVTFYYKTTKNGKTVESGGAIANLSKRDYTSDSKITVSKQTGSKYTSSQYNSLIKKQTSLVFSELKSYLANNTSVTLPSLGFDIYK